MAIDSSPATDVLLWSNRRHPSLLVLCLHWSFNLLFLIHSVGDFLLHAPEQCGDEMNVYEHQQQQKWGMGEEDFQQQSKETSAAIDLEERGGGPTMNE